MMYKDRIEAGRRLAELLQEKLEAVTNPAPLIVLGLPRGGVVLAAEISRLLHAPLGVIMVRKIVHPSSPEFAIGAVAEDDEPIYNQKDIAGVDPTWLKLEEESARELIDSRRELYYDSILKPIVVKDKVVILVDDGIATGLTMRAAASNVIRRGAQKVIIAAPVASIESCNELRQLGLEIILLENPTHFLGSVGAHYQHFDQVHDLEVHTLLSESLTSRSY